MSEERKARARHGGYYGGHRRPGEVFQLSAEADFAASWMEPVGWTPSASAAKPAGTAKSATADDLTRALARIGELEGLLDQERQGRQQDATAAQQRIGELEAALLDATKPAEVPAEPKASKKT